MSNDITDVTVVLTAGTNNQSVQGFGRALLLAYHTHNVDLDRIYVEPSDMVADGFSVNEPAYVLAQATCSQSPRPADFMIGRLPTATPKTFTLTVTDATAGSVLSVTLTGKDGVPHVVTRTVPSSSTPTAEASALAALITTALGTLGAAASAAAVVTVTPATTGDRVYASGLSNGLAFKSTAAVVDYPTALGNIQQVTNDWYALAIEHQDATNVQAAAGWAESNNKLFLAQTADTVELATGTAVLGPALKASAYKHTAWAYSGDPAHPLSAGWLGARLPYQAGQANWAYAQVTGTATDNLTASQRAAIESNNGNHYTTEAGIPVTRYGITASGQWIDQTIGIDWITARMKEAVMGVIANNPKVPYTDEGLVLIKAAMLGVLGLGVANGFLVAGSTSVTMPLVANVSPADKGLRILNNAKFYGTMAGAINKANLVGSLSV